MHKSTLRELFFKKNTNKNKSTLFLKSALLHKKLHFSCRSIKRHPSPLYPEPCRIKVCTPPLPPHTRVKKDESKNSAHYYPRAEKENYIIGAQKEKCGS